MLKQSILLGLSLGLPPEHTARKTQRFPRPYGLVSAVVSKRLFWRCQGLFHSAFEETQELLPNAEMVRRVDVATGSSSSRSWRLQGLGLEASSRRCKLWANQRGRVAWAPHHSGRACSGRGGARPRGAEEGGGDSGSRAHFLLPAAPGPHPVSTCGASGARPSIGGCWACTYQTGSP